MNDAVHAAFIAWSYIGVGSLTLALIGYVAWEALRVKRRLARLEQAGIRRRSSGATPQ